VRTVALLVDERLATAVIYAVRAAAAAYGAHARKVRRGGDSATGAPTEHEPALQCNSARADRFQVTKGGVEVPDGSEPWRLASGQLAPPVQ
jgi:hypothetical protein